MAIIQGAIYFFSLVILYLLGGGRYHFMNNYLKSPISRSDFPDDFLFGVGSSAYQYEGAACEGGRSPSIWDTFVNQYPEKMEDNYTGDIAIDFYHRYKEDIQLLKEVGMDAFRLSISWSRLLPKGKISRGVNYQGVEFYNSVIDELISKGIRPFVTIFHWDLPQTLEDEYGGFLSKNIVDDFRDYADLCFKVFGDRVKHWITLNEPSQFSDLGYNQGLLAPGRCSNYNGNCSHGNSATEPYIVGHYQLLAHAAAVEVYKNKYQSNQKGVIGITLAGEWFKPKSITPDLKASQRALDFEIGWILHPIFYGNYPPIMQSYVGRRLPKFSADESKSLKGSADFIGLNYYTCNYASDPAHTIKTNNLSYDIDWHIDGDIQENGILIGEPTALFWIYECPSGIRDMVLYVKKKYNNPVMYITENGWPERADLLPVHEAVKDGKRVQYFEEHLTNLQEAIKNGANVKGYFAWTFIDSFEWTSGFSIRFGMYYVDLKDGLKRYPKHSALWFKKFLKKKATK